MCIQNRYSSRCKHERSHAIVVTYALYTADSFLFALLVMLMLPFNMFWHWQARAYIYRTQ